MNELKIKNALISVYDKKGIVELSRELEKAGVEIISTSGTYKVLSEAGIRVKKVEEIARTPELLGGRVKTLQPEIFASILVNRENNKHIEELETLGLEPIDLVVVNLYPFEKGLENGLSEEEMIELIDIGGASLLRAGAKNYKFCLVLTSPEDYEIFLQEFKKREGFISIEYRKRQAEKAFRLLASYNRVIADYYAKLLGEGSEFPNRLLLEGEKLIDLRYGENPHQKSSLYRIIHSDISLVDAKQLGGKEMSYNNWMDTDAAVGVVSEFTEPCVAIIKHSSPCGVGIGESILEAFKKAKISDPVSAFGGIIASNREVDFELALAIIESFFEVLIAPGYSEEALSKLKEKKNLRILEASKKLFSRFSYKKVFSLVGSLLVQENDSSIEPYTEWKVVSKREPTKEELQELDFAWKVVKWVKSNAIVLAKDLKTIGIGGGHTSRVDAVEFAILKAKKHGHNPKGSVMASDAFFPFRDSIDLAKEAGITAIVEPGGSVRDEEVIKAANEHNIALLFTGRRHFRH
ncbi:MAG: bifunctional phosphoribosylaminoimidazolecarboxamide formyltransferase/IMP cyclohydrolase [candidate division WOR-3 bacterium]